MLYDHLICKPPLFHCTWDIPLVHEPLLCVLPVPPLGLVHHRPGTERCSEHSARSASGSSASEYLSGSLSSVHVQPSYSATALH
jgi:hypothetical protein